MIEYYSISIIVENENKLPWTIDPDSAEIGKKGRMCNAGNGLRLNSHELAEDYAKRYEPLLLDRYGHDTRLLVVKNIFQNTPVYGLKIKQHIANNSAYAIDILKNGHPIKVPKHKDVEKGWIIVINTDKKEKYYAIPAKKANQIMMTNSKEEAKLYQRLNAATKYAEKINKLKNFTAFIIETDNTKTD